MLRFVWGSLIFQLGDIYVRTPFSPSFFPSDGKSMVHVAGTGEMVCWVVFESPGKTGTPIVWEMRDQRLSPSLDHPFAVTVFFAWFLPRNIVYLKIRSAIRYSKSRKHLKLYGGDLVILSEVKNLIVWPTTWVMRFFPSASLRAGSRYAPSEWHLDFSFLRYSI